MSTRGSNLRLVLYENKMSSAFEKIEVKTKTNPWNTSGLTSLAEGIMIPRNRAR